MNVESTSTAIVTRTSEASSSSSSSSSSSANKTDTAASFKDQLVSVSNDTKGARDSKAEKTTDAADAADANTANSANGASATTDAQQAKIAQDAEGKTAEKAATKETADKLSKEFTLSVEKNDTQSLKKSNPSDEFSSNIAKLSEMMKGSGSKTEATKSKTIESTDKVSYCQTMKMDNNDINFFLNLVNNQQMVAQNPQNLNGQTNFSEVKAEVTQSTVQVSATLLDAMNESAKTGKPFRIDFDSDIAVIMKVDKQGVLSANFIPGSAAVENYLRNNIEGLRQAFDKQDLPYNQLSYSNQQKQNQRERQSQNNKEESHE